MTETELKNLSVNIELTLVDMETIINCLNMLRIESPEWYEHDDELQEDVMNVLKKIHPQYRVIAENAY